MIKVFDDVNMPYFKEIESSIKPIADIDEIPFSKYTQTELNFA